MSSLSILIAEDDPGSAAYLKILLEEAGHRVYTAATGVEALLALEQGNMALVLSDLDMPVMDGADLLRRVKARWPDLPFVFVSVDGDVSRVVELVREGATNYLVKPVSPSGLISVVESALGGVTPADPQGAFAEIIGRSRNAVEARHQVCLASRSELHVLIAGETGTGKELVSRCIHAHSARRAGRFVAHNCALSPRDLFESTFFGHVRGAFTGADRDHRGLLEEADGGVLFLDELEAMPPAHQAMLLRVIDDGEVRRIGDRTSRRVSVRFIGATNRDLLAMMRAGDFREDLYYRLRGHEIRLAPLRDRREDIPTLVAHFLAPHGQGVTGGAMQVLRNRDWPGNVRELRNVVEYARTAARTGQRISLEHLPECVCGGSGGEVPSQAARLAGTLKDLEREAIRRELERCSGNRTMAARFLGIDRSTMRRKMVEYGIEERPGRASVPLDASPDD